MRVLLMLLLGCGGGEALAPLAPPEAEIVMKAADKTVGEGEAIVVEIEAVAADDWTVDVGAPQAEGLTARLVQTDGPTRVGDREKTRWTYEFTGDPGSYIVMLGPSSGAGPGDQTREFAPPPIFVDIGTKGPSGGPMAGFEAPPQETGWPWTAWAAIAFGIAVLLALGAWLLWRVLKRAFKRPEPPPEPPHVTALREWTQARDDRRAGSLDDAGLALELSRVLRVYLEAICAWPATARTTREILTFLEREGAGARRLDVTDRMRTSRILDATDRLKFAREGGGEAFFDALDEDFQAVISATRPLGHAGESNA